METVDAVGNLFICGFHGHTPSAEIIHLVKVHRLRNVILMRRNIKDAQQLRTLVSALQHAARESGHAAPLLIGIDQECGLVSPFSYRGTGTAFPGAMAASATNSLSLTYQGARATARELRSFGIGWVFAPDVDINNDPKNPVIGSRSFGDDPERVTAFATAFAAGLRDGGVLPCAKHFPGHGDTATDSHLALPVVKKDYDTMFQNELVPFIKLSQSLKIPIYENDDDEIISQQPTMNEPIDSIMTAHLALPELSKNYPDLPASINPEISTTLLRQKISFKGVIVTDCLEMDAIPSTPQHPAGLRALQAGADVAMMCHTYDIQLNAVQRTIEAVNDKTLPLEDVLNKANRISDLHSRFWGPVETAWEKYDNLKFINGDDSLFERDWNVMKTEHNSLSQKCYDASTTIVRDPKDLIPLNNSPKKPILLISPTIQAVNLAVDDNEITESPFNYLERYIKVIVGDNNLVHIIASPENKDRLDQICSEISATEGRSTSFSTVIFITRNAKSSPDQLKNLNMFTRAVYGLAGDNIDDIDDILNKTPRIPLVVVATCAPYDFLNEYRKVQTYLATYEYTPSAMLSLSKHLFGTVTRVPKSNNIANKTRKGNNKLPISSK